MRALFIALLLLNLAFFGWAHWIDAPPAAVPTSATDASLPTLQLEPAVPTATATASATAVAAPTTAAVPTRCRSIGPFADPAAALTVAGVLRSHGIKPHERSDDSAAPQSYWIYIGEFKDPAEQRRAIERLNNAGIHDVSAMTDPNQAGRVSVGIFSDQAHAVRRAEQVRQLGFKPVLNLHPVTQYWLDMTLKSSDSDPALAELSGAGGDAKNNAKPAPNIGDCPAKGGSG